LSAGADQLVHVFNVLLLISPFSFLIPAAGPQMQEPRNKQPVADVKQLSGNARNLLFPRPVRLVTDSPRVIPRDKVGGSLGSAEILGTIARWEPRDRLRGKPIPRLYLESRRWNVYQPCGI